MRYYHFHEALQITGLTDNDLEKLLKERGWLMFYGTPVIAGEHLRLLAREFKRPLFSTEELFGYRRYLQANYCGPKNLQRLLEVGRFHRNDLVREVCEIPFERLRKTGKYHVKFITNGDKFCVNEFLQPEDWGGPVEMEFLALEKALKENKHPVGPEGEVISRVLNTLRNARLGLSLPTGGKNWAEVEAEATQYDWEALKALSGVNEVPQVGHL